jgi:hypothetical protein
MNASVVPSKYQMPVFLDLPLAGISYHFAENPVPRERPSVGLRAKLANVDDVAEKRTRGIVLTISRHDVVREYIIIGIPNPNAHIPGGDMTVLIRLEVRP